MAWGFQTWDKNGIPNNKGFVPTLVSGHISLSAEQTGQWWFEVPAGYSMDYLSVPNPGGASKTGNRRKIYINGGYITVSSTRPDDYSLNTIPSTPLVIVIFLRK